MSAAGRYGRFVLLAALIAVGLGALGAPLSRAAASPFAVPAMIVALVLCWAAAAIGGLPVLVASRRAKETGSATAMLSAPLAAMALRLGVVAVGAAVVVLGGLVPRGPFLLWTGVGYVALLVGETWYAVGEARRRGRPAAAAPGRDAALAPRITGTETETETETR
ncbi:MAG TPA: hypothetical protein VM617_01715 [Thermoanaerobaculia bacterium]|nr:hypothetical protein [Thermoanaerobaculia bacterium]